LVDRLIHRRFDARGCSAFLDLAFEHALEPGNHAVHRVIPAYLEIAGFVMLDGAVNIDYRFAMLAPSEHAVEKGALPLTAKDEVDERRHQRDRHQHEVAQIVQEQLELKNHDVAHKVPAIVGAGR
jgi:hypothetical protein